MHEEVTVVRYPVEIPYGIVEYTAMFTRPILEAWIVPASIILPVLAALDPFGFKIGGVELKAHTEKLSEYEVLFRRAPAGVTFRLGMEKLVIVAENLDWGDAEQFVAAANAGIEAVRKATKAQIDTQHIGLGMHIQLKDKPRAEITSSLLSAEAYKLLDGELKFPGVILQREKGSIVVDASLAFANGLFVRINREHGGDIPLKEIAEKLLSDEVRLFDVLGLEGTL